MTSYSPHRVFLIIAVAILAIVQTLDNYYAARYHCIDNRQVEKTQQSDRIFVVSLQGTPGVHKSNLGRLDSFTEALTKSCGFTPAFEVCDGVYNSRRGYGPTLSFLFCLEKAQLMNFNVTIIFEDDARINNNGVTFCDQGYRQRYIWSQLPSDTFIAFLGGHSWKYSGLERRGEGKYQFIELKASWGAYAYAVPKNSLRLLIDTLKEEVIHGTRKDGIHQHHNFISPETAFYTAAEAHQKKIYVVKPLLVWHEGGYSNTWQKERVNITGYEVLDQSKCVLGVKC